MQKKEIMKKENMKIKRKRKRKNKIMKNKKEMITKVINLNIIDNNNNIKINNRSI
jgi:hypothetical protein